METLLQPSDDALAYDQPGAGENARGGGVLRGSCQVYRGVSWCVFLILKDLQKQFFGSLQHVSVQEPENLKWCPAMVI